MRFWRKKLEDEDQLKAEVEQAKEQLARAEKAQPHVEEVVSELRRHTKDNHLGERLREHFEQSNRRPGHGTL